MRLAIGENRNHVSERDGNAVAINSETGLKQNFDGTGFFQCGARA